MVLERAEGSLAEHVGAEPLLSVLVLQNLVPVGWGELEDPVPGPTRQEAEEVSQVAPRLDIMQLAAGEQRDEGGIGLCAVVASDEEPVFSPDGFAPQRALRAIVMQRKAAVLEESAQGRALVARVADGLGGGRL